MKRTIICLSLIVMAVIMCVSGSYAGAWHEAKYKTSIFARGAALNGTVSLHFSPDGEMFVIDAFANKLLKMNHTNGKVIETLSYKGFEGPADLVFEPDGTMYWVNTFAGQIYKKTPDGEPILISQLNPIIDGLAVNAQGRVFTASFTGESALYEVDPDGIHPTQVVTDLGGFDAFDFCPDGYLYAPDYLGGTGQIYKIDIDTGDVSVVANGFSQPISTKFNSRGELHVLDTIAQQVVKVDIKTGEKTVVANTSPAPDNFDFSPEDEIFIAFDADSYIGKVLPDGTVKAITKPGLASPGGISIRSDGSLFVASGFTIKRYNADTGELNGTFYNNNGIIPPFSFSDDGTYFILTCMFAGVQIWNPATEDTVGFYNDFKMPVNAIRFMGDLVVAEAGTGSVVRASDRMPLIQGLKTPAGLAAKGEDLWVGDRETGIIWKAVEFGQRLDPPVMVAQGLASPEGITIDNDGALLVMEVGSQRLIRIDSDSGDISVVADNLAIGLKTVAGVPSTWAALSSVAVSESGVLYATGDVGNVIYKIEKKHGKIKND